MYFNQYRLISGTDKPIVHLFHSTQVYEVQMKQESPPAWTQEAYRPPCIEYSFCCPTWVPPPHPDLAGGVPWSGTPWAGYPPILTWPGGVPDQGTPPGQATPQAGYPPILTWPGGVPDQGTPCQGTPPTGYPPAGYPPQLDLAVYTPPPAGPGRVPPWLDLAG